MKHLTLLFVLMALCPAASGWGKRGHQIVGETAALVVSGEPGAGFMRDISYDFGYYANVPDLIWKRPATYKEEQAEHFIDLEIFMRAFEQRKDVAKPFELSRAEFDAKFPEIPLKAGRSYWRIRELYARMEAAAKDLREFKEEKGKERQKLQEKWLLAAGPLAHYIGDLGVPLHVTENYDGQMTGQKGLHSYFEEEMVSWLYPELLTKVHAEAVKQWPAFKKKHAGKSVLELARMEAEASLKEMPALLKLDKGRKRSGSRAEAKRYEAMIARRMVSVALTLAELYRRNLGWKYDGEKFYFWAGEPAFIKPGEL